MAARSPSPSSDALPEAINAPFMKGNDPIRASMLSTSDASARGSKLTLPTTSLPLLDKEAPFDTAATNVKARKRSLVKWVIAGVILLIVVVLAVVLPVYFTVIKPNNHQSAAASAPSNDGHNSAQPTPSTVPRVAITGGDGSTVTTDDGTKFTYQNKFGGFCEYFLLEFMSVVHSTSNLFLAHPSASHFIGLNSLTYNNANIDSL